MKPLRLEMQAFGPYAGIEIIDFTQLENRTMFVISGKTGAGKTSIFDGISFAIYGKASGEDRNGSDLRSHFAKDELPTEVSLQFQLRDKIYYIWRSPQQDRKKTRGDGYTTVNAKAELYLIDESGSRRLIASNVRETDEKIREIIQLDANQFRQILMIPQGDFRKLLTSESKEKEIILQRLFHTQQYKKIEEKLKEKAGSLKNEAEYGIDQRSQLLKGVFTNENEALEAALAEKTPSDNIVLPLLAATTEDMMQKLSQLEKQIDVIQKERDEAKRKMHEAENILNEMKSLEDLKRRKIELDEKKVQIDEKKNALDLARRAVNLEHQENICQRLKKDLDDRTIKKNKIEEELSVTINLKSAAEKKLKQVEGNRDKRENLHAEMIRLENLRDEVLSFSKRKNELYKLEQKSSRYGKQLKDGKVKLANQEKTAEKLHKELNELRQIQDQTVFLKEENLRLNQMIDHVNQLAVSIDKEIAAKKFLELKEKELIWAKAKAEDASETLKHIEGEWYSGQAAILAGKLVSGLPCPVCGSIEHPSPAHADEGHFSEEDMEAAKKSAHLMEENLAEVRQIWITAKAEADFCKKNVLESHNALKQLMPDAKQEDASLLLKELQNKKIEITAQLEANSAKIAMIPEKDAELTHVSKDIKELNTFLEEVMEKERQAANDYVEMRAALQSLTLNLPEGVQSIEQYDKKLSVLRNEIKLFDDALDRARENFTNLNEQLAIQKSTLENIVEDLENIQDSLKVEREEFLNQMQKEGFTAYSQYAESKKEAGWIKSVEDEITSYGEDYRSITDLLRDYEVRLKGKERPDIERLENNFKEKENTLVMMNGDYSNLMINIKKNEEIQSRVCHLNEQIKEIEKQYEIIGHLSDITKGQNAYRLTFERFVLASFLDDILAAANGRLLKMTSGRYQLLRKKERSKGNVQSGLELLVFDQYTGQERHVKTLSGGESFKAALSLALGLADVVQEHAGGVSLETMFIDEGFGTLDPESLDQAIEALMEIQSTGRLVGIISHVPELKERIDARLEVLAGQSGSSTEFVFLS